MRDINAAKRSVGISVPELPNRPFMPDEETRRLRAKLLLEEALEQISGLGFDVYGENGDYIGNGVEFVPNGKENLAEIADGIADVSVINIGTAIACGLPDVPLLEAVDFNNMAKFGPGHSIRADGKLIKPPNHPKPDFAGIIRNLENGYTD